MPIDRHRVGAKPHRGIGYFKKGDVVAHENADAAALPDTKRVKAAGDGGGAIGNFGMTPPSLAAGDAEEKRRCFGHCFFRPLVGYGAPHPEEPRSGVSKDDETSAYGLSFETPRQSAAPRDEVWGQTSAKRGARF